MIIRTKSYARVGLMGNPSDGYFGKTISCAITNFCAKVTLWESPKLQIIPNPIQDPTEFGSLKILHEIAVRDGYYGGLRLILASCKKFFDYCKKFEITLPDRNFTIAYETDIPRQVGLGGSSAIITATIKAIMQFYEVTHDHIPKPIIPNLILSVETEELEINAGLQDRVIQTYGGTVFMDFAKDLMLKNGHGNYEHLDSDLLPDLFLAYISDPSDSGRIHNDVKFRYDRGDDEVIDAMKKFGSFAAECKTAIEQKNHDLISELMDKNFDLRRKIYGDRVIGAKNLEMIHIARENDCPAKFSGSGGAIVGIYQNSDQSDHLEKIYTENGFGFAKLKIDKRR